ncbi:glycosyltransferase family 2 protein [Fibrobacter sp. UWH4]|uniref:glycosyltransferase family 2 protein n=1 Tax=Fibrobacter sp. UWH4 TaxID=1896210 RepID=UPI00091D4278|nr:glycosyltransferase family 2 protein [Fibrobacter sp. UWH4]SHL11291.1 Glycosyltransferase involved in cell wall bisynthesis [Fibrobacter sp. UWH4]
MISVCMATYNGGKFIREQLESILSQLSSDAEIVVADDGSTDDTLSVVASLGDSRIRVLPAEKHFGVIYNYERTLQASKGEIIFLADQDDVWLPGKVEKVLAALNDADLVTHDAWMLSPSGASDFTWTRTGKLSDIRTYRSGVVANWWKNSFTGCCMAFRRNVLDKALPFPKNLPMHDQWLGLVAEKYFKVSYVNEPLVEYRQHSSNATHIEKSPAGVLQKIKWRVDLLKAII